MKHNVGGWDRNLRWVFGGTAVVAALTTRIPLSLKIGLLVLGAAEVATATARYCPVSEALGIDTTKQSPKDAAREAAETALAV